MVDDTEARLKPLKTFRVTTPRGDRIVHAHRVEFAGEMNGCLWFFFHLPDYETELVHAFAAGSWTEVVPVPFPNKLLEAQL